MSICLFAWQQEKETDCRGSHSTGQFLLLLSFLVVFRLIMKDASFCKRTVQSFTGPD